MNLSFGHRVEQRLTSKLALVHEQRLTHTQRLALNIRELALRRGLVEALHNTTFTPRATCPACRHGLSDYEIMKGFLDNPTDFTTGCPKCKYRFEPRLFTRTMSGSIEMAFFCPAQTLAKLEDMTHVTLDAFRTTYSEIYHSAVLHFGGLKQAFGKLGLVYSFEADLDWQKQVIPFLGKLPDTVIAELTGTFKANVRQLRIRHSIRAFSRRNAAKSLSD